MTQRNDGWVRFRVACAAGGVATPGCVQPGVHTGAGQNDPGAQHVHEWRVMVEAAPAALRELRRMTRQHT